MPVALDLEKPFGLNAAGALARHVAEGDPEAIETLYRLVSRTSRYLLSRRLRDEDPDDFLHETLTIVVDAIRKRQIRNPAALLGYVKSVVRRQGALCVARNSAARRRTVTSGSFLVANATSGANPETELISRERSDLMHRGLVTLCQRDRELLTRFYLLEEPFHQICIEMNLTETQFRLYKSRAKARLVAWVRAIVHR
ncbi:MAG: sigma-70 family RNA polymerase sigma factor [Acidobacteria bacterium]|nr:sigma-70 family RNA polymerase sigma factor [Acidobacteriota bacterium]